MWGCTAAVGLLMTAAMAGWPYMTFESCDSQTLMWRKGWTRSLTPSVPSSLRVLRSGENRFMSGDFGSIVERRELRDAAPPERAPDQAVGEVRILGQQRAV